MCTYMGSDLNFDLVLWFYKMSLSQTDMNTNSNTGISCQKKKEKECQKNVDLFISSIPANTFTGLDCIYD